MTPRNILFSLLLLSSCNRVDAFSASTPKNNNKPPMWFAENAAATTTDDSSAATSTNDDSSAVVTTTTTDDSSAVVATDDDSFDLQKQKIQIIQLGAALDRGQAYNPTAGEYYKESMAIAKQKIESLIEHHGRKPTSISQLQGEWELIFSTVPHGIFRSSPFFLAIQEAYNNKQADDDKAQLFFKLHELQTCSWGISKIGRVAQRIKVTDEGDGEGMLYSEFDTSIFSLTVIPIVGWGKLLPTFGGCVVTAATCELEENNGVLNMEVEYTASRPVPGLQGLGEWIWKVKVPVGYIWKLLPWNQGRPANCSVEIPYVDDEFRIAKDIGGDYFVYTRPVIPRPVPDDDITMNDI